MALFNKITKLTSAKVSEVIEGMLEYYSNDSFFESHANTYKVEDYLKPHLDEQIPALIEHGHSYEYKGNFICSCDVDNFVEEYGEIAERYFSVVSPFLREIKRENNKVAYIGNMSPKNGNSTNDMFMLFEHVRDYWLDRGYTIFIDSPTNDEYEALYKNRYAKNVIIFAGKPYFRWSPVMRK